MVVSELTHEQAEDLLGRVSAPGVKLWGAVLEEEGVVVGHVFLSFGLGQCFGHDMDCQSKDKRGAALLWSAARRAARGAGAECVLVHVPIEGHPMQEFWESIGFEPIMTVFKGDI